MKINQIRISLVFVIVFIIQSCSDPSSMPEADLILFNGVINTLNSSEPVVEAVAVIEDTIYAVGSNSEILKFKSDSTKIIDLKGKFVSPGLNESHAHFLALGESKNYLNFSKANNWDEIIFICADEAAQKRRGEWIVGRGWHQEKWDPVPRPDVNGYPVHNVLSQAVSNNPVMLIHASGHKIFANKYAMNLANINKNTPSPEGGEIVKDDSGNLTGLFKETAAELIKDAYEDHIDKLSKDEKRLRLIKNISLAEKDCIENGITSFTDAGSSFNEIDIYKELVDSGKLEVRLNVMIAADNKSLANNIENYRLIGYGNNFLTVRSIKKYMDGALGSRGAWLLEPYSDAPEETGFNTTPVNEIFKTGKIAIDNNMQLCVHAIGDRANRETLNLYEKLFRKNPEKTDLRWRIEHAQHISKEDIPRFSELGIIAAMQSIHCISDAVFVEKRLGHERAFEGAYIWQKLLNTGTVISNGTDAPVENIDPIKNFYAAVTRKTGSREAFFASQAMTRIEALKSYTTAGAYASFEENIKGKIEPGMLADFTIFTHNLLKVPDNDIKNTKIYMTIIGGKIVYKRDSN